MFIAILEYNCCQLYIRSSAIAVQLCLWVRIDRVIRPTLELGAEILIILHADLGFL